MVFELVSILVAIVPEMDEYCTCQKKKKNETVLKILH